MNTLSKTTPLTHLLASTNKTHLAKQPINVEASPKNGKINRRREFLFTTLFTAPAALIGVVHLAAPPIAFAENWGTRSFIRERFFEPGLSPEDAVARIRQTAEGLHSMRPMLEAMSWKYVMYYIRLKQAYLSQDLKSAFTLLPENRRNAYVKTANDLVENMLEVVRLSNGRAFRVFRLVFVQKGDLALSAALLCARSRTSAPTRCRVHVSLCRTACARASVHPCIVLPASVSLPLPSCLPLIRGHHL
ncbi:hypothetical protein Sjap_008512 [Stephania japonica]|uniref:Photosynthetic NDH subunit of lumenal location 2, chloroplastic n=1 Tax=Stephania japonica TaxID=461633 RepID=A0AAP0PAY1_9MAGN